MARNKYPEETVQRILDVSLRLFLEKGYEHATIQDMIDALGNLSRGAIYHHFKGKEEIFEAVVDRLFAGTEPRMRAIARDKTLNGREKLRRMFCDSLQDANQLDLFTTAPDMRSSTRFLAGQLQNAQEVALAFVAPIVREGVRDGSVETDYPDELAETLMLLMNVLLNPMIFRATAPQLARRYAFCRQLLQPYRLDILDDAMLQSLESYRAAYERRRAETAQK